MRPPPACCRLINGLTLIGGGREKRCCTGTMQGRGPCEHQPKPSAGLSREGRQVEPEEKGVQRWQQHTLEKRSKCRYRGTTRGYSQSRDTMVPPGWKEIAEVSRQNARQWGGGRGEIWGVCSTYPSATPHLLLGDFIISKTSSPLEKAPSTYCLLLFLLLELHKPRSGEGCMEYL